MKIQRVKQVLGLAMLFVLPLEAGEFKVDGDFKVEGILRVAPQGDLGMGIYQQTGPAADTDGDGLADDWEIQYFGNLSQGPTGNPDWDAFTNLQEYQQGSNPILDESAPPLGELFAWYRAAEAYLDDAMTTLCVQSGVDGCAVLKDLSGNNRHLQQGNAGRRPLWRSESLFGNLSAPGIDGWIMPYLLRKLSIERANQVWAVDITYIRLQEGFCYLVAIMDWYSRFVLSWRLSNTLDGGFCMRCLENAVEFAQGAPEILNSDQGSQFTSREWVETVCLLGSQVSHDGAGRALHNVMIERVWRSLKYEDIYLKGYSDMTQAGKGIGEYFLLYNYDRPHQTLDYQIPATLYLK